MRDVLLPCSMRMRVGCFVCGSMSMTLETWIAFSNWSFCPGVFPCFFTCFVTILTPSTTTLSSCGNVRITFASIGVRFSTPSLFFSIRKRFLPAMMRTISQVCIFIFFISGIDLVECTCLPAGRLDYFRSLGNNSLETLIASELSKYWSEDTSPLWFTLVIDDHTSIVV